jgi:integrase
MSPLRQALVDYLAVRRSLGFKLGRAEGLLLQFVNYAEERGQQHLLTSTMLAWATLPVNTTKNWLSKRLSIVRGFASHLHTIDPATEVPPTDLLPWQRCRATPYLYSDGEVAALITAASSLRKGYRALTFQTLIGLLAATGMRVGEALALDRKDIDVAQLVLTIRLSKFGKSRELQFIGVPSRRWVAISAMATVHLPQQVLQPFLFRILALGCLTRTFSTHFKCLYTVPDSHGAQQCAAPEFMIFGIASQSRPCLTLIAVAKTQKRGLRFCRPILAT